MSVWETTSNGFVVVKSLGGFGADGILFPWGGMGLPDGVFGPDTFGWGGVAALGRGRTGDLWIIGFLLLPSEMFVLRGGQGRHGEGRAAPSALDSLSVLDGTGGVHPAFLRGRAGHP